MSNWSRNILGVNSLSEVSQTVSISSNTITLDLAVANVFFVTLNANINTITISNTPSGVSAFTLVFTADGTPRSITWTPVVFQGGTPPTITSTNGKIDVISCVTTNGGSNWYGFVGGQNY